MASVCGDEGSNFAHPKRQRPAGQSQPIPLIGIAFPTDAGFDLFGGTKVSALARQGAKSPSSILKKRNTYRKSIQPPLMHRMCRVAKQPNKTRTQILPSLFKAAHTRMCEWGLPQQPAQEQGQQKGTLTTKLLHVIVIDPPPPVHQPMSLVSSEGNQGIKSNVR
jgi:hypothetical protein